MGENQYTISVNINTVNGFPGKKLTLRLGGNPFVKKDIDFIYWLNVVYVKKLGISLKEFCEKSEEERGKYTDPIWQWTEDGMTRHLKRRMEDAGMPSDGFGFPSLRAGFLESTILHGISSKDSMEGVLTKAAVWQPYSRIELGYFKNTTRATIITTDRKFCVF